MVTTKQEDKLTTTIKVSLSTKKKLDDFKIITRETYDEAIKRALEEKV